MSPSRSEALDQKAAQAAAGAAFLLIAHQVAARAVRDALFLSAFEVKSLPLVMGGAAIAALGGAELLSLALARRSPARVVPAAAALSALLLVAWWGIGFASPRAAALLVYLHVSAFGGALVSGFWSLVNERFDPHTARKVVGRIGTGATAGGMAGGALVWLCSRIMPLPAIAAGARVGLVGAACSGARASASTKPPRAHRRGRCCCARTCATSPSSLDVTEALLDFQFKAQATERFVSGPPLLGAFAVFHTAMGVLSLLLQATLSRTSLRQLGIAGTLALRPLLTALSSLAGTLAPRLATATLARGAHESLTNSLFRSAYELLYTPVPEAEKRRVKALVDVSVDKAGALLGSAVVALVLALAPITADALLFGLACLLSLAALVLSPTLHHGYVQTLEQSLLAGRVRLDTLDPLDHTSQGTLAHTGNLERDTLLRQIALLRGEEPSLVPDAGERATLDALRQLRSVEPATVRGCCARTGPEPLLVTKPLLANTMMMPTSSALRRAAPRITGQLVDAMLDTAGD
jgi:hypothetical protein